MQVLNIRVPKQLLDDASEVAKLLNADRHWAWAHRNRADVLRTAMQLGLEQLRRDHTPDVKKPKPRTTKKRAR